MPHPLLGMSVEAIALVLHHSKAAKDDLVVMIGIANHEGDGGAWPTIATLAKYARKTARAVQNSITRLTEIGEVEVDYNAGGNVDCREDHRPNRYTIHLACPPECDRTTNHRTDGVKPTTPRDALAPANGVKPTTERGEVHDADGVKPTSPKPSLEPSRTVPSSAPSSRKARTSPEADSITREWWERNVAEHGWRPGEGFKNAFVSMRGIVHHALAVEGYTDDEVRQALVRIGPRSFTKAQLSGQCFGIRREHEKSAPQLWWQGQEGA